MKKLISSLLANQSGSNALEYGLIVGLVSLAIVVGAGLAGTSLGTMFTNLSTTISALPGL
jgi:pilus assembly protein Flp/PilA